MKAPDAVALPTSFGSTGRIGFELSPKSLVGGLRGGDAPPHGLGGDVLIGFTPKSKVPIGVIVVVGLAARRLGILCFPAIG